MKVLATIDLNDYDGLTQISERYACRGIIIKDNKIAMVHSNKGEYKFPGGGIEPGENKLDTLVREVKEESGLIIKRDSIKEFGEILEKRKSSVYPDTIFIHHSYYYLCNAEEKVENQILDLYEKEEEFKLVYVTPEEALRLNKTSSIKHTLRESKVIELIKML